MRKKFNTFHTNFQFLYHLKTSEKQSFSDVLSGIEMIYWRKIGYRVINLLFLYKVLLIAFSKIACPVVPLTYLFFPQVKYIKKI